MTNKSRAGTCGTSHLRLSLDGIYRYTMSMFGRKFLLAAVALLAIMASAWAYHGRQASRPFPGDVTKFASGLTGYSSDPVALAALKADKKYQSLQRDGENVIRINGPGTIVAITPVNIDTSKTYNVSFRVRVIKDDAKFQGSNIFAGVATYDSLGRLETARPGAHRYAALSSGVISANQGWVTVEGRITGAGNSTPNQFRATTKQARPIILFNYRSDAIAEISAMKFEEAAPPPK